MNDEEYGLISKVIKTLLAIDLSFYKPGQMQRRLTAFVERYGKCTVPEFCTKLKSDPEMQELLRTYLTINVTEFFRDATQFDALRTTVLPEIIKKSPTPKIWSAGSSRGNEAYSVAMYMDQIKPGLNYTLVGTDIDEGSIQISKNGGPYPDAEVKNAPVASRQKYFEKRDTGWYVKPEVVKKAKFSKLDLLSDRFERYFDLIMCRNVVIYFSDEAKKTLNEKFAASLKPGGVLFVGGTETILNPKVFGLERFASSLYHKVAEPQSAAA